MYPPPKGYLVRISYVSVLHNTCSIRGIVCIWCLGLRVHGWMEWQPVYDCAYITSPGGGFPGSFARQPRGCQYRATPPLKTLGETLPTPTFLAPPLFQLWRYRPWEIGPRVCDMHRRICRCIISRLLPRGGTQAAPVHWGRYLLRTL